MIEVTDLTALPSVNRELALIKVKASPAQRGEIIQVADVFRAKVMWLQELPLKQSYYSYSVGVKYC